MDFILFSDNTPCIQFSASNFTEFPHAHYTGVSPPPPRMPKNCPQYVMLEVKKVIFIRRGKKSSVGEMYGLKALIDTKCSRSI
jgi:hypothetical protein